MAQNVYDDPVFFAGYSEFPRSRHGLAGTAEWPAMRRLLPRVDGLRVLDLGCGFGQFSRWAAEQGARSVLGIDLSENMLARARAGTTAPTVVYERQDLVRLDLADRRFDLAFSSMALHYLEDFGRLLRTVFAALEPGGRFVFSVEHPIYAARSDPEWVEAADGRRAFAITGYSIEGPRVTNWVVDGVLKYHRTIGTMVTALLAQGFTIDALDEWRPDEAELDAHPDWRDDLVRPMFLLMAAGKPRADG